MKYLMIVDRRTMLRDVYEVEVPESILADIMMNSDVEISQMDVAEFILNEYEPTDSYIVDSEIVDVDLEQIEDEVVEDLEEVDA